MNRRSLLGALGAGAFASLDLSRTAHATLVRGLTLEELSAQSARILLGTPLDASSQWAMVGGRRRIVTDTRIRVEDVVAKTPPEDSEILVRTLGGTVGTIGALVHGEAEFALDEQCLIFLRTLPDALHQVTAMAQGHYPLRPDPRQVLLLQHSPRATEVLARDGTAIRRLVGRELPEARRLIREAIQR